MIWLQQEFDFAAGAILNFNKPIGKSSFWLVKKIRGIVQTKVGHAGTLDPFAEGVLLVCTGKATKQVSKFMEMQKEYIGEIELGITTNTDDPTGEIIEQHLVPGISRDEFKKVCSTFVGEIYQVPPMFSAKKVNGERLYKLARKGMVIERAPKLVYIDTIEVLNFEPPVGKIKVTCSKGTYIRALARDIGEKIGCGGYLKSLIRTRIGDFSIDESLDLDGFKQLVN
jgi:tRNA pseudouridine55 synthase